MKKNYTYLVGVLVLITSISFITPQQNVFICKGSQSKRFHLKEDCRGLQYCSTEIYEVTLEEAKKIGRTLCGWED
ncbi:hypothetical protein KC678_01460 [Candidatus Dojkabacteria bacterium]|uniref:Uncharacterized protein n=1 Tax=Candidatus Dojkabacteria bacterium TaxID=2099670 RepID=A0A955I8J3_9BACT|nr:hypothetical protein [Candidatus Dojkabacteria bacterium]